MLVLRFMRNVSNDDDDHHHLPAKSGPWKSSWMELGVLMGCGMSLCTMGENSGHALSPGAETNVRSEPRGAELTQGTGSALAHAPMCCLFCIICHAGKPAGCGR